NCHVTTTSSLTVEARDFTYWDFHVISNPNGTITSSPSGLNCGPHTTSCVAQFPVDSDVVLTITPEIGYSVAGFDNGIVGSTTVSSDCQAATNTCVDHLNHDPRPLGANVWPQIKVNAIGPHGQIAWFGGAPFLTCDTETTTKLCRAFPPDATTPDINMN